MKWITERTWRSKYKGYDVVLTSAYNPMYPESADYPYSFTISKDGSTIFESKYGGNLENMQVAAKKIIDQVVDTHANFFFAAKCQRY